MENSGRGGPGGPCRTTSTSQVETVLGGTTTAGDTNLRRCAKTREREAEVMTGPLCGQAETENEECAGPVKNDRKENAATGLG